MKNSIYSLLAGPSASARSRFMRATARPRRSWSPAMTATSGGGRSRRLDSLRSPAAAAGALAAVALLLGTVDVHAQGWQGFVIGGVGSMTGGRPADNPDYMDHNPEVSVGVLHTLGSRFSVGLQGDFTMSNGYPGARGGGIVEVGLLPRGRAAYPFLKGGFFTGVNGEQLGIGAGIDLLNSTGVGLRLSVQDAFNVARYGIDCAQHGIDRATCDDIGGGIRTNIQHEPSLQIGFSWR